MKKREVAEISHECLSQLAEGSIDRALETLGPLLSQKLPFPLLDHAGYILGSLMMERPRALLALLDKIEATKAMGGYVIIGRALGCLNDHDLLQSLDKAKENLGCMGLEKSEISECVLASDSFFPFTDSIEFAHEHGIRYIVQPGGSVKDKEVIEMCDVLEIAMIFTGRRMFKH